MEYTEKLMELPVEHIRPNPYQPRTVFEEEGIRELAGSIRRHGILQPLTVRRQGESWELIAGERRLRAAKLAGLEKVPCVLSRADDDTSALLALVENLQRRDLHYLEEAAAIAAYIQKTGITQEEAAARLSRSPSALANKLRLLRLEDESERVKAAKHIAKHRLNVAQAEQYIEHRLAALQSTPAHRRTFILKDVRLFLNSLDRGLRLVREAGIDAQAEREETEEGILLMIHIPKARR